MPTYSHTPLTPIQISEYIGSKIKYIVEQLGEDSPAVQLVESVLTTPGSDYSGGTPVVNGYTITYATDVVSPVYIYVVTSTENLSNFPNMHVELDSANIGGTTLFQVYEEEGFRILKQSVTVTSTENETHELKLVWDDYTSETFYCLIGSAENPGDGGLVELPHAIEVLSESTVTKDAIILSVNENTVDYIDLAVQRYMSIDLTDEGVNNGEQTVSYFYTESSTVKVSPLQFSDLAQYFDGELILYNDSYNLQGVLTQTQFGVRVMEYTMDRSTDVRQLVSRFISILQTSSSNVQTSAGYTMSPEGLATFIVANGISVVYFKLRT